MSEQTAYPLTWPVGQPRTNYPDRSRFDCSQNDAQIHLSNELKRMGARYVVISTNMKIRNDGLPYAKQREPEDRGVAVYFQWKEKQMTFACDRWDAVRDNMRAIAKTIEAIRGIARWGASDMMERAFSAFEALPSPNNAVKLTCWNILGIEETKSVAAIKSAYRKQAKGAHPDYGGTAEEWSALQDAYQQALNSAAKPETGLD